MAKIASQNMSKSDEKEKFIKKTHELITGQTAYPSRTYDLFNLVLFNLHIDACRSRCEETNMPDPSIIKTEYWFSRAELIEKMGVQSGWYFDKVLKEAATELTAKTFHIRDPRGNWKVFNLVQEAEWDGAMDVLRIRLNETFIYEAVMGNHIGFSVFSLRTSMSLDSVWEKRIYEFICRFKMDTRYFRISMGQFCELLSIPEFWVLTEEEIEKEGLETEAQKKKALSKKYNNFKRKYITRPLNRILEKDKEYNDNKPVWRYVDGYKEGINILAKKGKSRRVDKDAILVFMVDYIAFVDKDIPITSSEDGESGEPKKQELNNTTIFTRINEVRATNGEFTREEIDHIFKIREAILKYEVMTQEEMQKLIIMALNKNDGEPNDS